MRHQAYLALGSNLGDRAAHLAAAIQALRPAIQPLLLSPIYETPPWGYLDQPAFLNQVAWVETNAAPLELLLHLKQIEADLGRLPSVRYGPRCIDLDILIYDTLVIEDPLLTLPHARLHERAFVLVPLSDLAPNLCHPRLGTRLETLRQQLDCSGIILYPGRARANHEHSSLSTLRRIE